MSASPGSLPEETRAVPASDRQGEAATRDMVVAPVASWDRPTVGVAAAAAGGDPSTARGSDCPTTTDASGGHARSSVTGGSAGMHVAGSIIGGRYRLIARLAEGGMGVTYRAWDTEAQLPVVVKMPKPAVRHDQAIVGRFAREIDAMRTVPHESIVPITDSGDDAGCPFVVMRFLPGGSLADYRRRGPDGSPLQNPPGMLFFWLPGIAAALDHIHGRGMLHRDVKPGNIFLDGFLRPFLGDFGLAKVVDDSGGLAKEQTLTATRTAVGTPEYMAPELFKPAGKLDGRVDQYALAVTVYEMLCGQKPFDGSTAHIIVEHLTMPLPALGSRVSGLPESVCDALTKALAKDPKERFRSCGEFAAAVLADLKPIAPEADTVRLLCPSCRNILKLPSHAASRTGRCPRCRKALDVADDLGSLWLESEERTSGPVPLSGSPAPELDVLEERQSAIESPKQAKKTFPWAALAVTAVVALVAGSQFGGAGLASIKRQHADEVGRLQTLLDEARAELATYRGDRDRDENRSGFEIAATQAYVDAEAGASRADAVEVLTNSIGMKFILCPEGQFTMGDANGGVDEKPAHPVTITAPFYLGMHEVTNAEWKRVMGSVPSRWPDDDGPVEQVTWFDAGSFCSRLSALPEEQRAGRTYRLPTEAEWEYACRAGSATRWSYGDDDSGIGRVAWFSGNSGGRTHPVGTRDANAWGLRDMHGNVWEWVQDSFGSYTVETAIDPKGPPPTSRRVSRGGGWGFQPQICASASRLKREMSQKADSLGLRVVVQLAASESPRGGN